jgi:subtilisin-like proprotein convertase family protein
MDHVNFFVNSRVPTPDRGAIILRLLCIFVFAFSHLTSSSAETFAIDDGGVVTELEPALDELSITTHQEKNRLEKVSGIHDLQQLHTHAEYVTAIRGVGVDLVLYSKNKPRDERSRRILTQRITVQLAPGIDEKSLAKSFHLKVGDKLSYAPGFYIFETHLIGAGPDIARMLRAQPRVLFAEAMLARQRFKRFTPNDPLFPQQWHLLNTGQNGATPGMDINITNIWESYHGSGIVIGIVDDGLLYTHPDLTGNCNTNLDYDYWNNDSDPKPEGGTGGSGGDPNANSHGTTVAGLVSASGQNGIGVTGAAFQSTLVGIRVIVGTTTDDQEARALSHSNEVIQIYNNSWGSADDGATLGGAGVLVRNALATGATTGRNGKGNIFVWAGGNGALALDNANYDNYANSIYTIAVGGLNDLGKRADYSEPGACLVVSAPAGGEVSSGSRHQATVTTDLLGDYGYNRANTPSDLSDKDYTKTFNGTSASAPLVAGVAALMLEANPNLGWRDVQEILIASATRNDPADSGWLTNGWGFKFHHSYGAGLVNATAAVNMAKTWRNLPAATNIFSAQTGLNLSIPDNNTNGITQTFDFSNSNLRVEHVTVTVSVTHTYRGDLAITLTSPSGTISRLAEKHNDGGTNYSGYTFMSTFNWSEISRGIWTVKITDLAADDTGTLTSIRMDILGTPPIPPLLTATRLPDGRIQLLVDGYAGRTNFIQASTTLTNWTTIFTSRWPNGVYSFIDASTTNTPHKFYRVTAP